MERPGIKLGGEFRPSQALKTLYYVYFVGIFVLGILTWLLPIWIFVPLAGGIIFILILPFLLFTLYWIPKYYGTISYRLTKDDMTWRRGVWFRNTGIVPYNRITNIDIAQGPVSRHFGIASLKIQTAGYSGASQRSSEIKLEGIEKFEELRELIMGIVRGKKPVAVEAYESGKEETEGSDVLRELVKIRKLLEKGARK